MPTLARQSDGIHLSRYGADLGSNAVYKLLDTVIRQSTHHATPSRPTPTVPATTTTAGH